MGVVLLSPLPRYCRLTTARNEYDANTDRFLAIGRFTENGAEPYQRGVAGSPSCSMTASGTLRASCQPRDPRVGDKSPVDVVVQIETPLRPRWSAFSAFSKAMCTSLRYVNPRCRLSQPSAPTARCRPPQPLHRLLSLACPSFAGLSRGVYRSPRRACLSLCSHVRARATVRPGSIARGPSLSSGGTLFPKKTALSPRLPISPARLTVHRPSTIARVR